MVVDAGAHLSNPAGYSVGVVTSRGAPSAELERCLEAEGVAFVAMVHANDPVGASVHVLLLDLTEADRRNAEEVSKELPAEGAPAVAAISWELLRAPGLRIAADDVIVVPWRAGELRLRLARLLERKAPAESPGVIRAGDLVIDPERYEVHVAGKPALLTFKEYELLKLLASNPGRVYSREVLLEQVWGYRYFGGTRTVDVHVRRLRSKIEDATHNFIETVWNVGYRFHG